ncbi:TM0106 family RecB-like putative nuclease [Cyanobacterium stanieri LEGE 03274]|uniref:TM0106 family RecB-like putative nuclease n=1 Tax=Cyanobacterium stanieri LEGE 03274 TaxID=1828756 RepID=A0ABR9V6K6_9CHRO|nr:TM0106 family RecB-like putative nuclease [Cyanobacterium stanieri]MBE9223164.1 TM0106 family RecB-like putative nuclease [Cyanobacterium stanieri LEGE 03274]
MLITDDTLLQYKRCNRKAFLNFHFKNEKPQERDFVNKLKQERILHTQEVIKHYNWQVEHPIFSPTNNSYVDSTLDLMRQGVDCIYNGELTYHIKGKYDNLIFQTNPTLLIKQNIPSGLGNWSYLTVNTHLGKNHKPEYKLVAAFQGWILGNNQGFMPTHADFIVRSFKKYSINLAIWWPKVEAVINDCQRLFQDKNPPEVFISRQKCGLCEWYNDCHEVAVKQNHLSLIPGITPRKYEMLKQKGVENFEQVINLSLPQLSQIFEQDGGEILFKQIQSLRFNAPILKRDKVNVIPSSNIELYFDIEAEPDRKIDYLLGVVLVDYNQKIEKYYHFLAEDLQQEKEIWLDFLEFINGYPNSFIYHFSGYEVETIKRLASIYQTPKNMVQPLLKRLVDVHKFVTQNYLLPMESYSLKSLGKWLNFQWRIPPNYENHSLGGDQCVVWYDQWLSTGDRTYLDYILMYNEDDCRATFAVKKWLVKEQLK